MDWYCATAALIPLYVNSVLRNGVMPAMINVLASVFVAHTAKKARAPLMHDAT